MPLTRPLFTGVARGGQLGGRVASEWAVMRGPHTDEFGRFYPGSVEGWGASWWFHEQGLVAAEMNASERLQALMRYFNAVDHGSWDPPPREQWLGPYPPY